MDGSRTNQIRCAVSLDRVSGLCFVVDVADVRLVRKMALGTGSLFRVSVTSDMPSIEVLLLSEGLSSYRVRGRIVSKLNADKMS